MRLALDLANFTPVPTPPQLQCLKDGGYTRAIVGCSYGTVADMQLAAFYAFGFEVEAYAWVAFGASWQKPLDHALTVISHRPYVRRLWLDVEEQVTGMTSAQYEARIDAVIAYVRSKRPDLDMGIYTGRWWWLQNLPACTKYAGMPLFTAQYVTNPAVPPGGVPLLFGGWQEVAIWQYAGSVETCGLNIDRCVMLEPVEEDEDMKPFMAWDKDRQRAYLIGPFGAAWITQASDVQTLEGLYGKTQVALLAATIDALQPVTLDTLRAVVAAR